MFIIRIGLYGAVLHLAVIISWWQLTVGDGCSVSGCPGTQCRFLFPDNLLGISWVDSAWIPILNNGSVLDYFSERSNPFYDRTCNNEVVKMQRMTLDHLK